MKSAMTRLDRLEALRISHRRPDITGFRVVIYDPEQPVETIFRLVPDDAPSVVLLPDNGRDKAP